MVNKLALSRRRLLASAAAFGLLSQPALAAWPGSGTYAGIPPFPSGAIGLWNAENAAVTTGGVPYVPNSASSTAVSNSIFYQSRRLFGNFNVGGGTVVDNNATGPDGLMEASTCTMSGSWNIYAFNYAAGGDHFSLPAGTYTIAVSAKSGTGSSQTFNFNLADSVSGNMTATTSWSRLSYTATISSGNHIIGLQGSSSATIEICDLEVFVGSSDLGPVTKAGHLYLGASPYQGVPGYGSNTGYIDCSSGGIGLAQMYSDVANPLSTWTFAFYINAVNYPDTTGSGTACIVSTPDLASLSLRTYFNTTTAACIAAIFDSVEAARISGSDYVSTTDWWTNIKGAGPHVLTFVWDGTAFQMYWDDTRIVYFIPSSTPSATVAGDFLLGIASAGNPGSEFKLAAMGLWNTALTATQIYNLVDNWNVRYSTFFKTGLQQVYVFAEGDSITDGTGATYPYTYYTNALGQGTWPNGTDYPNQTIFGCGFATGGSTIASPGISFPDDYATFRVTTLLACLPPVSRRTGRTFIISLYFGQNDYSSDQGFSLDPTGALWITGTYEPYITSLVQGGFNKVIIGTIFSPGGTGGSAETMNQFNWREGANSFIYNFVTGGQANAIMDFNGNANLGAFQAGTNGTYFNLSSTPHPSTLSQETIMAPLYLTAINSVL